MVHGSVPVCELLLPGSDDLNAESDNKPLPDVIAI